VQSYIGIKAISGQDGITPVRWSWAK
jgi:hypothetical protein